MSKPVKILTLTLWIVAVAGMVVLAAVQLTRHNRTDDEQVEADIFAPQFTLTDQLGHSVSTDDLKGRPWVADFIFTECASACPLMSKHLSDLQSQIPATVRFVSFSVDPEHDTPPVLLDYAKQYGADNDRWKFLTGDKDMMMAAIHGLKVSVVPATAGSQIEHDIHFLLIDSNGRVSGIYDSRTPDQISQLVTDATALAGSNSK